MYIKINYQINDYYIGFYLKYLKINYIKKNNNEKYFFTSRLLHINPVNWNL